MYRKIKERKAIEEITFGEKSSKDGVDAFGGRFVDVGDKKKGSGDKESDSEDVEIEITDFEKIKREVELII